MTIKVGKYKKRKGPPKRRKSVHLTVLVSISEKIEDIMRPYSYDQKVIILEKVREVLSLSEKQKEEENESLWEENI